MNYTGGRAKKAIVDWVIKKSGPPSIEVECGTLVRTKSTFTLALIYFGDFEDALFEVFMESARDPAINDKFALFHKSTVR